MIEASAVTLKAEEVWSFCVNVSSTNIKIAAGSEMGKRQLSQRVAELIAREVEEQVDNERS